MQLIYCFLIFIRTDHPAPATKIPQLVQAFSLEKARLNNPKVIKML